MSRIVSLYISSIFFLLIISSQELYADDCKVVKNSSSIKIDRGTLKRFKDAGLDRKSIFTILKKVAKVETDGCWNHITENFDGQILSAGVLQWNYGQNSIQFLLENFKERLGKRHFKKFVRRNMPHYGKIVFHDRCLASNKPGKPHPCARLLLDRSDPSKRKLHPVAVREFEKLFASKAMVQIQMDEALGIMSDALAYSYKFFGRKVTQNKFHWVFDVLVHQGSFGRIEDYKRAITRVRRQARDGGEPFRRKTLKGIMLWYAGLVLSPDQRGYKCDWRYNLEKWTERIAEDQISEEQYILLVMSWLRARVATGSSGRWQALAFQRRAKIALGVGSAAHHSLHKDNNYLCHPPKDESDYQHIMQLLNFDKKKRFGKNVTVITKQL